MFSIYALGDRLKKTVKEIEAMPVAEFNGWLAFYKMEQERNE
jgi:hypothetical protein